MRAKKAKKILLNPDPIYGNRLVTRIINRVMKDGKKTVAQKQVYQAMEILKEKFPEQEPVDTLRKALDKIKPQMEVRSRRVGGGAYQVPMPVKGDRKEALAIRWTIEAARKRSNSQFHSFAGKFAAELMDALNDQGAAFTKKINTHKAADANKAFAHFRW
jgi:small subunit ribosomal protein S7